jgi:hypothetical protein
MPTFLGTGFSPEYGGYPTRMSSEDVEIWRRYYPTVRAGALVLYFDVGLGLADELPAISDPDQLLGWIKNTQKRADVLIERAQSVDLIELRFNATANAVGRLLMYQKLLEDENPLRKKVNPILVSNRFDGEVERLCRGLGFGFVVA